MRAELSPFRDHQSPVTELIQTLQLIPNLPLTFPVALSFSISSVSPLFHSPHLLSAFPPLLFCRLPPAPSAHSSLLCEPRYITKLADGFVLDFFSVKGPVDYVGSGEIYFLFILKHPEFGLEGPVIQIKVFFFF